MLYLKKTLSKFGLSAFSVSLFYHTAGLILLTCCCAGNSHTYTSQDTETSTFTLLRDVCTTVLLKLFRIPIILHIGDVEYSLSQIWKCLNHSLTSGCFFPGQFQVVGPPQPVIVTIGEDIILPCHLKPAVDAVGMTIEWARLDLSPRFVHVWHQRKDLHVNQHPSYKGRTSMSINRLQHGDISLTLTKVKISDEGMYRCYLPDGKKDSTVQLVVGK